MTYVRQTSIETYHAIEEQGLLSRRRLQVYQWLWKYGPATGGEVATGLRTSGSVSESIRNRLTELRNLGVVHELEEKPCPITGRKSIVWDVTDRLPRRSGGERRETTKEKIKRLEQEVEMLRRQAASQGGRCLFCGAD